MCPWHSWSERMRSRRFRGRCATRGSAWFPSNPSWAWIVDTWRSGTASKRSRRTVSPGSPSRHRQMDSPWPLRRIPSLWSSGRTARSTPAAMAGIGRPSNRPPPGPDSVTSPGRVPGSWPRESSMGSIRSRPRSMDLPGVSYRVRRPPIHPAKNTSPFPGRGWSWEVGTDWSTAWTEGEPGAQPPPVAEAAGWFGQEGNSFRWGWMGASKRPRADRHGGIGPDPVTRARRSHGVIWERSAIPST